jgi:DNA-binding NarL/FixJ family response regulator
VSIRILVVDGQELFARGMRALLQGEGFDEVSVATSADEALTIAQQEEFDIALIELSLPGTSGIRVAGPLLDMRPDTKMIALTTVSDPRAVRDAVRAGFRGFLTKQITVQQLLGSIRSVMDGQGVISPRLLESQTAGPHDRIDPDLLANQLTDREREVLTLLGNGYGSSDISHRMAVAPNTVRTHIQNILTKLQVHSRLEAVAFAQRHGIIEPPSRNSPLEDRLPPDDPEC